MAITVAELKKRLEDIPDDCIVAAYEEIWPIKGSALIIRSNDPESGELIIVLEPQS